MTPACEFCSMSPGVKTLPTSLFTGKVKPASPAKSSMNAASFMPSVTSLSSLRLLHWSAWRIWILVKHAKFSQPPLGSWGQASLSLKRCLSACLSSVCQVEVEGSSHMCLPPLDRFFPRPLPRPFPLFGLSPGFHPGTCGQSTDRWGWRHHSHTCAMCLGHAVFSHPSLFLAQS